MISEMRPDHRKIRRTMKIIRKALIHNNNVALLYSGGKDSTLLLHLTLNALLDFKSENQLLHIIFVDTLVEIPIIVKHVKRTLTAVKELAKEKNLHIKIARLHPNSHETFWYYLFVKGYTPPNWRFRWCVKRLKINPFKRYLRRFKISAILMGLRKSESLARKRNMEKRGDKVLPFFGDRNVRVYLPLSDWSSIEVWNFLAKNSPPWGGSHSALFDLYGFTDDGNSNWNNGVRFGCWVCTVVRKDKAMQMLGQRFSILKDLLEWKEWLRRIDYERKRHGKNGRLSKSERRKIYNSLIQLEKKTKLNLINKKEKQIIEKALLTRPSKA